MKTPSSIVPGNGESLQDILIQIKLNHPKLKFPIPPLRTLEKEFGKEKAEVIRKEGFKQGFHLDKSLGKDL